VSGWRVRVERMAHQLEFDYEKLRGVGINDKTFIEKFYHPTLEAT
jgi:hypothetical protein